MPTCLRALVAVVATTVGLSTAVVATASPATAAVTDLKINEVVSEGTDWVEIVNTGAEPVELQGLKFIDGSTAAPADLVSASTLLAPGAYYTFEPDTLWGIGLGKGDSAKILAADGTTVIDAVTWPAGTHATPSYGRCADRTGSFVITTAATRGAANACPNPYASIVVNEVRSSDAAGGKDFVELTNTGTQSVDVSALTFVDNDPAHTPIPIAANGTTIAPGAFFSFDTEDLNGGAGYGLGKGDSVTILDGTTTVDTYTIAAGTHATPSVGRCPDGRGSFVTTATATPGAANDCPAAPDANTIKINEVNSDPTDWFELVNTGTSAVDVSNWRYSDSTTTTTFPIAAGTVVPAGGFVQITSAVGLGKGDAVHLFGADGLTELDTTTWPADTHATTWGRLPDGTGAFQVLAPTPGAANQAPGPVDPTPPLDPNAGDVEINEISSLNADDPGNPGFADAVELHNTGTQAVSIQGWKQTDSGAASGAVPLTLADLKVWDGSALVPATGWSIPAGGYVAFSSKKGLSGEGDAVKLYGPEGATQPIDEASYGDGDGGVSDTYTSDARAFAACPDGSDEFWRVTTNSFGRSNATACQTKSRRFVTDVVLNEVSNVSGKAELLNTGSVAEDISGWQLLDRDGNVGFTVPAGTSLAPGDYFVAAPVTGLDSADALTIRNPDGATIVAHTWYEDGIESYSRCELFGTVSYVETPAATWGAANACPNLATQPWPGPADVSTVDAADAFTDQDANDEGDVSGAAFDPNDPSVLWVAMNKGRLFKMHQVGGTYEAFPNWEGGLPVRFTDGGGELDAEGVTVGPDGAVYLTSERDNGRAKSVSANKIARFDVSGVTAATTELVATHQWDVNALVTTGTNLGLEGITYVPDSFLVAHGWKAGGRAYRADTYPTPGLFVTAVEATGKLHFFSLATGSEPVEVKVESSGLPWSMDVAFDPDRQGLWALCDDGCGGVYNLLTVADGDFAVKNSYARPAGMANLNNEGMAIAPWSTAVDGKVQVVWTDDGDTDGYSLRAGLLDLPRVDPPVVKATSTVTAPAVRVTYGRPAVITARVAPGTATGTVQVKRGSRVLGSAAVRGGVARVTIPARAIGPGSTAVTLAYLGDASTEASSGTTSVTVTRAPSRIAAVAVSTSRPQARKTRLTVRVRVVSTTGVPVTGAVRVRVGAKSYVAPVRGGMATVRVARQSKGSKKLRIVYLGSGTVAPSALVLRTVRWR